MPDETDLGEIVVTARRKWGIYNGPIPGNPPPLPGDTSELPGDGGSGGDGLVENPEDREKKDCAAKQFLQELPEFGRNRREYISLIYRQNGRIYSTDVVTEGGPHFSESFFRQLMSTYGITASNLMGWSHNHNRDDYCNPNTSEAQRTNRYPSEADIAWRDELISEGASAVDFVIYTVGCNGEGPFAFDVNSVRTPHLEPDPVEGGACEQDTE